MKHNGHFQTDLDGSSEDLKNAAIHLACACLCAHVCVGDVASVKTGPIKALEMDWEQEMVCG